MAGHGGTIGAVLQPESAIGATAAALRLLMLVLRLPILLLRLLEAADVLPLLIDWIALIG